MGFKALNQAGEAVYSFNLDVNEWANLKTTHNKQLKMSCCDAVAIPKTSAKGTPFFAHHTQGNCNHKPESIEHLFCKYLLILALKDQGWNAETEVPGHTPSGEKWIADVYATKGKSKIIFEVQWSGITLDEITRRDNKYKESGIRCVWLKRGSYNTDLLIESNRDLIIFGLTGDFRVFGFSQYGVKPYLNDLAKLSIHNFVDNLLLGRIQYAVNVGDVVQVSPYITALYYCDCGSKISVLRSFLIKNSDGYMIAKGGNEFNLDINKSELKELMAEHNVVRIKKRTDKYSVDVCCGVCNQTINRQIGWGNFINVMSFVAAEIKSTSKIQSYWILKNQDC